MLGMKPVAYELLSSGRFALRDFVFVMRKSQVDSAGVYVDGFPEVLHGHRGALDMPARAAGTNGGFPEMLAWFGGFPECEVAGTFLFIAIIVHARARLNAG